MGGEKPPTSLVIYPETNIAPPENGWLENGTKSWKVRFSKSMVPAGRLGVLRGK